MSKKSKDDTREKMDNPEQNANAENIEENIGKAAEEAESNDNVTDTGIEEKLAASEARVEQLIDQNLRQMAEFDNYRKRTVKEKAELIKTASADILTKLLPVIDDLERAITNNGKSDDITAIKDGTKLIYSKLMHILDGDTAMSANTANTYLDYVAMVYGCEVNGADFVAGLAADIG